MNLKNTVRLAIFMLIGLNSITSFAKTVNFAVKGIASSSNTAAGNNGPENAIDANKETAWNSGEDPLQWIEIDLGSKKEITEITALVDQKPEGNTTHNVFIDGTLSHTWSGFTNKGDLLTWILPESMSAQRIRIETPTSPSWTAWYEVSVLGSDATSTEYQNNIATLSNNFDLFIPLVEYQIGSVQLFYSANLIFVGQTSTGDMLWKLGDVNSIDSAQVDDAPSHLLDSPSQFFLKIDSASLNENSYWANFEYIGDNGVEGDFVWKLLNFGSN